MPTRPIPGHVAIMQVPCGRAPSGHCGCCAFSSLISSPALFFCFHVDIYVHCHKPASLAALSFTSSSFFMLHIQPLLNGHMEHAIHAQKACCQPCNEPQPSMTGEEGGRAGLILLSTGCCSPLSVTYPGEEGVRTMGVGLEGP